MKRWVFGYGSLVNRQTLSGGDTIELVTLKGWTREWRHVVETPRGAFCLLTMRECDATAINGAVIAVDDAALEGFDVREAGYDRITLQSGLSAHEPAASRGPDDCVFAYRSKPAKLGWATAQRPLLLSYIDSVLDGMLQSFGETGLDAFVRSTKGWSHHIRDDRAAPLYPRATRIDAAKRALFDRTIAFALRAHA